MNALANTPVPGGTQSPLELQRLRQIQQAEEQRRIKYLHRVLGQGAATQYNRLRLARKSALLASILGGGLLGAMTGYAGSADGEGARGALAGGLVGAGIGGAGGLLAGSVGSLLGTYAKNDPRELRKRMQQLDVLDYVTPGRANYLEAQLEKDFLENESRSYMPSQHVF